MNLLWLKSFIEIVDSHGITNAARRTNQAPSVYSKQLRKLEQFLKKTLIARTSRQFKLTEAGRSYYDYAKKILDLQRDAINNLGWQDENLKGVLRLALPTPLMRLSLLDKIEKFVKLHPGISIILTRGNSANVLLDHEADCVFTFFDNPSPQIVNKKLLNLHRTVLAAPGYLQKRPKITHINDLVKHNCLVNLSACPEGIWELPQGSISVSGNLSSVSTDMLIPLAVKGLGIIYTYAELAENELKTKKLQRVFKNQYDRIVPLYIACRPLLMPYAGIKLIKFLSED